MVIVNTLVRTILFVDLQDPSVLVIGSWKNFRRLALQEKGGVSAMAINKAANDEHETTKTQSPPFASRRGVSTGEARDPGSCPVVVEADANPFFGYAIGRDLMAEPAFKEDEVARLRWIGDVLAIFRANLGELRRGRHELAQTRILEFQTGATFRGNHIIGAADKGERMEVQRVSSLLRHDVNPAVRHVDLASPEIHLERPSEGFNVAADLLLQHSEGGGKMLEPGHGAVAGVPTWVILCRPRPARFVVVAQLSTLRGEFLVEARQPDFLQGLAVNEGRKPSAGRHALRIKVPRLRRSTKKAMGSRIPAICE